LKTDRVNIVVHTPWQKFELDCGAIGAYKGPSNHANRLNPFLTYLGVESLFNFFYNFSEIIPGTVRKQKIFAIGIPIHDSQRTFFGSFWGEFFNKKIV
jgi:hypothetical protein